MAEAAGVTQKCGKAIFADTLDPDYLKILQTFQPIEMMLRHQPRIDMPGGVPAPAVCRLTDSTADGRFLPFVVGLWFFT